MILCSVTGKVHTFRFNVRMTCLSFSDSAVMTESAPSGPMGFWPICENTSVDRSSFLPPFLKHAAVLLRVASAVGGVSCTINPCFL